MIEATPAGEPRRTAGDIAGRSIRVTLGGKEYVLAVLFIAGNERWRDYEQKRTAAFVEEMQALGNDSSAITEKWSQEPDMWLDLLYAYDTDCDRREGVLPPRETLKEGIFEDEPQDAVREVVKAANPKAAAAWQRMADRQTAETPPSSSPTSSPPRPTAGRSRSSAKH